MPNQIDMFNLIDSANVSFCIYYMDENGVRRRSEQLNAPEDTYHEAIEKWKQSHPNYHFLFHVRREF